MHISLTILITLCVLTWIVPSPAEPPSVSTERDTAVATEIDHRLSADRDVNAQMIRIDARAGVVTLTGTVPSADANTKAGKLAAAVPGVVDVHNEITVGDPLVREDGRGTILEKKSKGH